MSAGIRVNMAAIAARLAADDQEFLDDEEPFSGDAGELHTNDFGGGGIGVSMLTTITVPDTPNASPSGRTGNYPTALSGLSGSPAAANQYSSLFGRGSSNNTSVAASPSSPLPVQRSLVAANAKYTRSVSAASNDSRRGASCTPGNPSINGGGSTTSAKFAQMKREMVQIRANVMNALDALMSQREDAMNYIENTTTRYLANSSEATSALSLFDCRYVHMEKVGHDIPRIMAESDLLLKVRFFLNNFGDVTDITNARPSSSSRSFQGNAKPFYFANIKTPTPETITTVLAPVLSSDLSSPPTATSMGGEQQGTRFLATVRKEVTGKLFPFDDHQIPEMLLTINALINTDIVAKAREKLAMTDDQYKLLSAKIIAQEKEFEQLKVIEDYAAAEVSLHNLLGFSADRTDLSADRIGILVGNDNGGALAALDRILYNKSIAMLKKEKESFISQAKKDLDTMETDHHATHIKNNADAKRKYEEKSLESQQEIGVLVKEQKAIFDEIAAKLMQIDAIGKKVESKVEDHIKVTDVEQKRRQEYREYLDSYARHRSNLATLIDNSKTAIDFLETVRHLAQKGKDKIEQSGARSALRLMALEERRRYLTAYRHYGDNSHSNMARLDKKLANASHIQEDMRHFLTASAAQESTAVSSSSSTSGSRPATTDVGNMGGGRGGRANSDSGPASYAQRIAELESAKVTAGEKLVAACDAYERREDRFVDLMAAVHHTLQAGGESTGGSSRRCSAVELDTTSTADHTINDPSSVSEEDGSNLSIQQSRLLDNTDEGDLLVALRRKRVDIFQDHVYRLEGVAKGTIHSQEEVRQKHTEITEHSTRLLEVLNARKARRTKPA